MMKGYVELTPGVLTPFDFIKDVEKTKEYQKEYHVVQQDKLGDIFISTVWLPFDHQHDEGPPLIYETMIFCGVDWIDHYQERYTYRAEALSRHEDILKAVQGYLDGDISPEQLQIELQLEIQHEVHTDTPQD